MSDRVSRVACVCVEPTTAGPTPDKGRIEFESTRDQCVCMIQLSRHRRDRTSRGQNARIIGVRDACPFAPSQCALSLSVRRFASIVQDMLRVAPSGQRCRHGVVGLKFVCSMQEVERMSGRGGIGCKHKGKCSHRKTVRSKIFRPLAPRAFDLCIANPDQDCSNRARGNAIRHVKQMLFCALKNVSPELSLVLCIKQTDDDTKSAILLNDPAGQNITCSDVEGYVPQVGRSWPRERCG